MSRLLVSSVGEAAPPSLSFRPRAGIQSLLLSIRAEALSYRPRVKDSQRIPDHETIEIEGEKDLRGEDAGTGRSQKNCEHVKPQRITLTELSQKTALLVKFHSFSGVAAIVTDEGYFPIRVDRHVCSHYFGSLIHSAQKKLNLALFLFSFRMLLIKGGFTNGANLCIRGETDLALGQTTSWTSAMKAASFSICS